ncbi:hypothetical protein N177_1078 [Lutibaculum baratangense AMV1]|uniref:Uncharacterized protein n=1 Tax=Lutibaculum baratangense AMV1 TaxID=631454 RepID=V4RLM3_9HYPH|nr:hypothetical protein N177_1078 [Lutibaculum baratangense AMV1]
MGELAHGKTFRRVGSSWQEVWWPCCGGGGRPCQRLPRACGAVMAPLGGWHTKFSKRDKFPPLTPRSSVLDTLGSRNYGSRGFRGGSLRTARACERTVPRRK